MMTEHIIPETATSFTLFIPLAKQFIIPLAAEVSNIKKNNNG